MDQKESTKGGFTHDPAKQHQTLQEIDNGKQEELITPTDNMYHKTRTVTNM